MASIEALAKRRGQALERLSSASAKAAEKFGVEVPALDFNRRDPELGRVELVERVADFIERIVADVEVVEAEPPRADPTPAVLNTAADTPARPKPRRRAAKKRAGKK